MRLFISILLFSSISFPAFADFPTKAEVLDSWQSSVHAMADTSGLTMSTTNSRGESNTSQIRKIQFESGFGLSSAINNSGGDNEFEYRVLINPKYVAEIQETDSKWVLQTVITRDDPDFETHIFSSIGNNVWGILFDHVKLSDLRECNNFTFEISSKDSSLLELEFQDVAPHLERVLFKIDRTLNWLPRSARFTYQDSVKETVLTEWKTISGNPVYSRATARFVEPADLSDVKLEVVCDFDSLARTPVSEECFLSFYDLPEPPLELSLFERLPIFIWIASAAVVAMAFVFVLNRRKIHSSV